MKQANVTTVSASLDDEPEKKPTQALAVRGPQGVGAALSVDELKSNLEYIKTIMQTVMREGHDYGKIPGTGEKPTLLQPGAQKLMMTFQLEVEVKKEVLREYPGWHREYEMTLTIKSQTGKTWDGVGTCSTLEKKYAKRKASRKCPSCNSATILKSKHAPFEFFCWAKKGGCGATFTLNDPRIVNQVEGESENPDIPDTWNTVRKMAFKRAEVHGVINATNTSELWTQDLEEREDHGENAPGPSEGVSTATGSGKTAARPAAATPQAEKKQRYATDETRKWMILELDKAGCDIKTLVIPYFIDCGILMPNEGIDDLPLRWVPISRPQMSQLLFRLKSEYLGGKKAIKPYDANPELGPAKEKAKPTDGQPSKAPPERKGDWFFDVIIPVPRKGMKKADYEKNPDTIGSLYDLAHGQHDEEAAKRLFGLVHNWDAVPREWQGGTIQATAAEKLCREALDAFADWHEKQPKDR